MLKMGFGNNIGTTSLTPGRKRLLRNILPNKFYVVMGYFWSWAGGVFVEQESKSDMISGKSHYIRVTSAAIVAFDVQWLTKRNVSNFIW